MKRFCIAVFALALACSSAPHKPPKRDPGSVAAQRRRASMIMQGGEYQAAMGALDSLTRAFPNDSDLWENSPMRSAARRKPIRRSRVTSRPFVSLRRIRPAHEAGHAAHGSRQTGRALTEFELAVKADNKDAARYNYGVALNATGRRVRPSISGVLPRSSIPTTCASRSARHGARRSQRQHRHHAVRTVARSRCAQRFVSQQLRSLDKAGRTNDAEAEFRAALAAAPAAKENEYRRNYATHQLRSGKYEDASSSFEALIKNAGGLWSDTVYLARAKMELKRYDDAIAALEPFALDVESGKIPRSSPRIDRMPPALDEH
jgi:tetratricopeptide (TPR) repeat protein